MTLHGEGDQVLSFVQGKKMTKFGLIKGSFPSLGLLIISFGEFDQLNCDLLVVNDQTG